MAPRTVEHKRHQTDDHQSALFPTSASERVSVATIDHSTAVILDVGTMELKPSPREEELVKFIWNHGGPYQEVESVIARLYAPHKHSSIARPVGYRCPAPQVPESIERLLRQYLASRERGENLRAWFLRHSNEELRAYLAGSDLPAAERDLPPAGRVPLAVGE